MKNDSDVSVIVPTSIDSLFGTAEMMLSLMAASRFTEDKDKSEMEFFIETNRVLFAMLEELKKENKGFWWDFYVSEFIDLIQSDNLEAFSYYISQSTNSDSVNQYIARNPDKIQRLKDWLVK